MQESAASKARAPSALRPTGARWLPLRFSTSASTPNTSTTPITTMESVPGDSARIYEHLTPALYASVSVRGVEQCTTTLDMLFRHPHRARHVRRLRVSPDPPGTAHDPARALRGRRALGDGYRASAAVRKAAVALEVLHSFWWDGEELPPNDDMWFALRVFCTRLAYVGTTLGSVMPSATSHLYDFSDLEGFSLTFKSGFYLQHFAMSRGACQDPIPGYHRLWEMLIKRCPRLRELVLDGISPENPVDAHRLTRGRWPLLRKLVLGDIVLDWHSAVNPAAKRPFITFLEEHRALEQLHLLGYQPSVSAPDLLAAVHRGALAGVAAFSGTLDQVQALPHRAALRALCVTDPILLRESTPLAVAGVLQTLPALASLTIAFVLEHGYDNGGMLRTLVAACPHLQHLDLTCARKPSFTIDAFSRTIRPLCKLTSLTLRIIKSPAEEPLAQCGATLARTNPRLRAFSVQFTAASGAHALAAPTPARSSMLGMYGAEASAGVGTEAGTEAALGPGVREAADFELATDHHGLPIALRVSERRRRRGAWAWAGRAAGRGAWAVARYAVEMRPTGHPGRGGAGRAGIAGIAGLLVERSAAGEEARLLCSSVVLVALAMWSWAAF
ncbi:hypothetical protein HETIRDRAFT_434843 [Heterobasidion irregulare TC 32-1]|uniref:F-box domain-containing protein n=1 Tax=Heterobasidion irregulare (strain TC 32-1) TaxID=747525 RepID=W4K5F4_HETIT|nr:uncharacterized protein HETIRDRAFT_434843 [Heterobasidion irregulare TC 32-1]ETW80979.1 hypothetical protein HETIRDRAFT_434843 [Heterobasidion irregulare TC 32-1]